MKKIATFILLILLSDSVSSQNIVGNILDSLHNPVPFATVAILNSEDSAVVKGLIANETGVFSTAPLPKGVYILKITAVGLNTYYSGKLKIDTSSLKLPDIFLNNRGAYLHEVSVSAMKPAIEFKNGNIIVNIENSPLAKGNTVYDLLAKLPGVSLDNNEIRLNGKTGTVIMIDGRIQRLSNVQLLNMLKSMNAENVEKIELLKNPPVKYEASGSAGIIHIRTKKTKLRGFSGSTYTSASQGFYARSVSGMALNYRSQKIALFSGLDYNYGYYGTRERFDKKFTSDTSFTEFITVSRIKDLDKSLTYKIGADWFVNPKNIIGFKVDGGPGSYTSDNHGTNTISGDNHQGFHHLNATVYTPDNWTVSNYNLNAEHRFDTLGTVLNFTSDYTQLKETYVSSIDNVFLDAQEGQVLPSINYRSNNAGATDILASRLDFSKSFNENASFEAGIKISFINTSNNYLFERNNHSSGRYETDTSLTNNYSYSEQTYAVYYNYIRSFRKLTMQLGIRAENTNLTGRNTIKNFELKRHYYNLFPNISMEYALSEKHHLQLNANRRIDRPDYNDLNPFRQYRDQYSYYEGNPFLLPNYSNTIEFSHSYMQLVTNTFTYSRIDQVILNYTKQIDSTKLTIETVKNMKLNNYYAYSFFLQHSIKPWWDISANSVFSYIEFRGDISGMPFRTASFYYAPTLTNTFSLPKKTKLEIIAFYNSSKNVGLVQIKPRWMLSLAIKKSFFKETLDCSIGINDIFYSGYYRTGVNFENQNWNFRVTQDSRRLIVSINYNFGHLKFNERETNSSEQEKARMNH